MKPPAQFVAQMIHDQGLAVFNAMATAWLCTFGKMPEKPNDLVVTTFDFGSDNRDGRTLDGQYVLRPKVQIRVRAADYQTAYEKAHEIRTYLITEAVASLPLTVTVSGGSIRLLNIELLSDVTYMGQDQLNQRQHFSINIVLTPEDF